MIKIPKHNDNIIQFDRGYKECRHESFIVDEELAYVKCGQCGEHLDPLWVIRGFAHKENVLNMRLKSLYVQIKKAEQKNKCKCEHCGKMTHIQK